VEKAALEKAALEQAALEASIQNVAMEVEVVTASGAVSPPSKRSVRRERRRLKRELRAKKKEEKERRKSQRSQKSSRRKRARLEVNPLYVPSDRRSKRLKAASSEEVVKRMLGDFVIPAGLSIKVVPGRAPLLLPRSVSAASGAAALGDVGVARDCARDLNWRGLEWVDSSLGQPPLKIVEDPSTFSYGPVAGSSAWGWKKVDVVRTAAPVERPILRLSPGLEGDRVLLVALEVTEERLLLLWQLLLERWRRRKGRGLPVQLPILGRILWQERC
jgi:hypothetical protein